MLPFLASLVANKNQLWIQLIQMTGIFPYGQTGLIVKDKHRDFSEIHYYHQLAELLCSDGTKS